MACLLIITVVCVLIAVQLRPLMLDSAVKQLQNAANRIVNRAVLTVFDKQKLTYDTLMRLSTDTEGRITSLRADPLSVNTLKASVALEVQEQLQSAKELTMNIPLGTLCGVTMLSGMGPDIPCRAISSSIPQVQLQYHFDGAGINQTLHSIIMTVSVPLSVTMPLQDRDTEVKCSFLVGETVLVGQVPDNYTNVISDPEVADDIFNYGDAG
ncbi:MAG: sporulation protein YunB [Clostridia bacterium]|nr:sporulation protein YunB [Clostridia bacterium]